MALLKKSNAEVGFRSFGAFEGFLTTTCTCAVGINSHGFASAQVSHTFSGTFLFFFFLEALVAASCCSCCSHWRDWSSRNASFEDGLLARRERELIAACAAKPARMCERQALSVRLGLRELIVGLLPVGAARAWPRHEESTAVVDVVDVGCRVQLQLLD